MGQFLEPKRKLDAFPSHGERIQIFSSYFSGQRFLVTCVRMLVQAKQEDKVSAILCMIKKCGRQCAWPAAVCLMTSAKSVALQASVSGGT